MAKKALPKARSRIKVNIPGVTPGMQIGDLTVAQFVELIVQVSDELVAARLAQNPVIAKKALAQIRKRVAAGVDQQLKSIGDEIVAGQQAVLSASKASPAKR